MYMYQKILFYNNWPSLFFVWNKIDPNMGVMMSIVTSAICKVQIFCRKMDIPQLNASMDIMRKTWWQQFVDHVHQCP